MKILKEKIEEFNSCSDKSRRAELAGWITGYQSLIISMLAMKVRPSFVTNRDALIKLEIHSFTRLRNSSKEFRDGYTQAIIDLMDNIEDEEYSIRSNRYIREFYSFLKRPHGKV